MAFASRVVVVLVLAGCLTAPAYSATLQVLPTVDAQAVTTDGGGSWNITTAGVIWLTAGRYSSGNLERRGILEFDIGAIDTGATVQSALFEFDINLVDSGGPFFEFYGYSGDGQGTTGDVNQLSSLIGTSDAILDTGHMSATLSTAFVESIAGADYLGMVMRQGNIGTQAAIATEGWTTFPPRLTIEYTAFIPEPSTLASLASLALAGLGIVWWKRRRD